MKGNEEVRVFEKQSVFEECGEISTNYTITILLEIIRSEGKEGLHGFSYLAKKCYLAEKMRGLNLFGFHLDKRGITSTFIDGRIRAIEWFHLARVIRDETIRKGVENFYGELRQEHLTLCDEQVEERYLKSVANNADFKQWQGAIDAINNHPSGKDWHTVSVAVHLHSQLENVPTEIIVSDIKNRATNRNVSLPENVFDTAINLLTNLNLHQTSE